MSAGNPSRPPYSNDSQEDFEEVKRHVDAGDLLWLNDQLELGLLSPRYRLNQFFLAATERMQPLLSYCAASGHDKLAHEISKRCSKEELNAVDDQGLSALMQAAYFGRTALVTVLLAAGADHSIKAAPSRHYQTALALARSTIQEETAELLSEYEATAVEDRQTFLDDRLGDAVYDLEVRHRISQDDGKWLEEELATGRLDVEFMMTKDKSLLFYAVEKNKQSVVHPLLRYGADVHDADEFNASVLSCAAANTNLETFRLLLLYGATYRTYDEVGEASPEFAAMEASDTTIPA
eukprot:TRINITY_DN30090_c0_g1_i1.p1 TRINITY_DN30090_c0_g1~~TRINITY_DN30090_c0_g1_i1.p1  ORF type:complete len:309 (+),score=51.68 TRINITY_DN30090_c0_g1_i1:50-928(+)